METFAAFVGWDWADREHVLSVRVAGSTRIETERVGGRAEDLHEWAAATLERFGAEKIAVAIDAGRGAVIAAFLGYPHIVLYPVNPKAAADLRRALYPSGKKDDRVDSEMLLEMVEKHGTHMRPLQPADPLTRKIGLLAEHRRKLDDDRKREVNRLRDVLKGYYPQILGLFDDLSSPMVGAFLRRWPSLEQIQRARPQTIAAFFRKHGSRSQKRIDERLEVIRTSVPLTSDSALLEAGQIRVQTLVGVIEAYLQAIATLDKQLAQAYAAHPEHDLVDSFPGLGPVLGPRTVAYLGSDRSRFDSAEAIQQFTGVAPITSQTGGKHGPIKIQRRLRRPKFIHQTVVEWAGCSVIHSGWAKAFYEMKKEQNPSLRHYAILRLLAFKWLRILFRCWASGQPYDEQLYQRELARRGSPLATRLRPAA